jgi:hypothetical protein
MYQCKYKKIATNMHQCKYRLETTEVLVTTEFLGLKIDNFNWKKHIECINPKISQHALP